MFDLKWTGRHKNFFRLKGVNDIFSLEKENHIIIIPEYVKMSQAIDAYINKTNFYVLGQQWHSRWFYRS